MEIKFILNRREKIVRLEQSMTVLKLLRDEFGLKGTKEGCGEGECGACSVLLGDLNEEGSKIIYKSLPSCLLPVEKLANKHLVSIEGLSEKELSFVQKTFVEENAVQCGFCSPGFIISSTAFLLSGYEDDRDIIEAIDGHICRCTGYNAIRKAVKKIEKYVKREVADESERLEELVKLNIVPDYFLKIPERLKKLKNGNSADNNFSLELKKDGKIIAGGTDLLIGSRGVLPNNFIFIDEYKRLSGIEIEEGMIIIGANTKVETAKNSKILNEIFPRFGDFLSLISSKLIRNTASFAGNIVNASPIGDISVILIALRAELEILNKAGTRFVQLDEFFKGYKDIDLEDNEIITKILIPLPKKEYTFNFEKVSRRRHLDIASCNSAMLLKIENGIIEDCEISAGGVYPYPLNLKEFSKAIIGKEASRKTIVDNEDILNDSIAPISDMRGSEEYKRKLLKNLIIAHLRVSENER